MKMAYTEKRISNVNYAELLLSANDKPRNSTWQNFLAEWNSLDMKLRRARLEIRRNQIENRQAWVNRYVTISFNK